MVRRRLTFRVAEVADARVVREVERGEVLQRRERGERGVVQLVRGEVQHSHIPRHCKHAAKKKLALTNQSI